MKILDEIKQMMAACETSEADAARKELLVQEPSPRPVVVDAASTTNAPVRRTIRFVPKKR